MKKIKVLFLILVLTTAYSALAQSSEQGMLGFSCSFVGKPSPLVKKMSKLSLPSQHKYLKKLLIQGNNAERYLSVVLYEAMIDNNKIMLTTTERKSIKALYNSKAMVSVCSGCSLFQRFPMAELLRGKYIDKQARDWAERIVNN